jgi:hypothetical protein
MSAVAMNGISALHDISRLAWLQAIAHRNPLAHVVHKT